MTKKLTETERIRRELKGHDKIRWIDGEREGVSKELTKEEIIEIENRYQVTDEEREATKERARIKRADMKLKLEEEILRGWKEDAKEAEQKMMKAKSKQTVKKWARELQVCGMNIRELEREKKESEDKQRI